MPEAFSNGLTKGEAERLALLAEEAGEVVVACMKILRHGYESKNPSIENSHSETNRAELMKEIGHVMNAGSMMARAGDIDMGIIFQAQDKKAAKIARWLHHQ